MHQPSLWLVCWDSSSFHVNHGDLHNLHGLVALVLGELPRRCFVEYTRSIGLFLNPLTQSGEWIIIRQNFILALINGRDILARVKTRGEYRFFDDTQGKKNQATFSLLCTFTYLE